MRNRPVTNQKPPFRAIVDEHKSSTMTANTIEATLIYTQTPADGSKVFQFMYPDPITGERKSNHTPAPVKMVIEDLRGMEDSVTLDEAGFQFVKAPVKHTSFESDEHINAEYYPESIELLQKITGASTVICFDHSEFPLSQSVLDCIY